jgi:hypothetical protein
MPFENYEDDIFSLTIKFTENNIKAIIDWVIKQEDLDTASQTPILVDIEPMIDMLNNTRFFLRNHNSLDEMVQYYEKNMKSRLNPIARKEIEEAIIKGQNDRLRRALDTLQSGKMIVIKSSYDDRVKEYMMNTTLLLSQVIKYIKIEYRKRISETKKAIIDYIDPHKESLEELRSQKKHIEDALKNIDKDLQILGPDASVIKKSLEEKLIEIIEIEDKEIQNIGNISDFINEIRTAKLKFDKVIESLEEKKAKAEKQNEYLALVRSINARLPELKNAFDELAIEFKSNISEIGESLYILGLSINNGLAESLERQKEINFILDTEKQARIEFMGKESNTPDIDYIYDIKFLNE